MRNIVYDVFLKIICIGNNARVYGSILWTVSIKLNGKVIIDVI